MFVVYQPPQYTLNCVPRCGFCPKKHDHCEMSPREEAGRGGKFEGAQGSPQSYDLLEMGGAFLLLWSV